MKFFVPTLVAAAALTVAGNYALAQSTSGSTSAGSSPSSKTRTPVTDSERASTPAAGRPVSDSNKMGIAGPESPVDTDAPNLASCKTMIAQEEREKCLARAREVPKQRAARPGVRAASAATTKP